MLIIANTHPSVRLALSDPDDHTYNENIKREFCALKWHQNIVITTAQHPDCIQLFIKSLDYMMFHIYYGTAQSDNKQYGFIIDYIATYNNIAALKYMNENYFVFLQQLICNHTNSVYYLITTICIKGYLELFKYFMQKCCSDATHEKIYREKILEEGLFVGAHSGHLDIVQYLVSIGVDIHFTKNTSNVLNYVSYAKTSSSAKLQLIEYLVDMGCNMQLDNWRAYKQVCKDGELDIVKYLVSKGADVAVGRAYCKTVNTDPYEQSSREAIKPVMDYFDSLPVMVGGMP
jgi:hypothetical protein